jgi:hypothetical protein
MLRDRLRRLRVRWRRWRLFRAYSAVVKRRTGCVSFVPYIGALSRMEDDGLLEVEDGEATWYWPEETTE